MTTAGGSTAVSKDELLEQWKKSFAVARNVLAKAGMADDTHDVMQEVWISLEKSVGKFDPNLGELGGWVGRIAHHRAADHINASVRAGRLQGRVEMNVENDFSVVVPDSAEDFADRENTHQVLRSVLDITQEAMDNKVAFERTMTLMVQFDEEVKRAASAMGVSEEALRASRRETMRTACVVGKALKLREQGAKATLRILLECLAGPAGNDTGAGSWMRHMAHAAARSGGFGQVTPVVLMEVTGWEYNTCRQYLNQTRDLLVIARTVLEYGRGRIGAPPQTTK